MFLHSSGIIQCVFFPITKRTRKLILVLCILISGLDFEPPILAFLDLPLLLLYTLTHLTLFGLATSFFPTLLLWQLPQTSDAALQAKRPSVFMFLQVSAVALGQMWQAFLSFACWDRLGLGLFRAKQKFR